MHFFQLHQYSFSCSLINFFSAFHFQFFSTISKRLHMKDSMTLPALVTNIQKAHTPAPHVRMIQFISDVKGWIKPFLNKVKDHVCPHTYRFFEKNDQVRIKYKNWVSDQTWLLESPGQCILSSTRR